ncbi:MAG: ferric reductase-like transmembrane domain-containing protein [Planctomycetaceae bacterium]|nr:ferric reductase-like transmembrane domain-containing protein [Planctomycetaceae bacterium]
MPRTAGRAVFLIVFAGAIAGPVACIDWNAVHTPAQWLYNLGRSAALMGFVILCFQVVLTCRWKLLDYLFAIDRITNFHKRMGILVTVLLTTHVFLILSAIKSSGQTLPDSWQIDVGEVTLALLWVTVVLALTFDMFGLDYNIWRLSHKTALLLVVLGFIHSRFIGFQLLNTRLVVFWWILLAVAALAAAYRNIVIPLFLRRRCRIDSILPQTHDTFTLSFKPVEKAIRQHKPGQFMWLTLKRPGRKSETHPFTIASSPTALPALQVTIKQSGNYTNTIGLTRTTDTAIIEGPYGRFSMLNYPATPLLFIAGGVGITPVMSMIRYLRDTGDNRRVILLYGNKTADDIIFKDELNTLASNFTITHILSRPSPDWSGPKGHITGELIGEHAQSILHNAEVFLCGPPAMMDKIIAALKQLAVPAARVHYERFTI